MANRNIGITIKGLHNGVHISSSEMDRQTSSICDSYVVSNGLYTDGFAEGILYLCVCAAHMWVCACFSIHVGLCMHTFVCMFLFVYACVFMCMCV